MHPKLTHTYLLQDPPVYFMNKISQQNIDYKHYRYGCIKRFNAHVLKNEIEGDPLNNVHLETYGTKELHMRVSGIGGMR